MEGLEAALNHAVVDHGTRLRFSNFLVTISTNVIPKSTMSRIALTQWLDRSCRDLFADFDSLNGTVIKPAGSPNEDKEKFPPFQNKIVGIRALVTIEEGGTRGQMHAHIVLEISHLYAGRNEYGLSGVHLNRMAINEYFNDRIPEMQILDAQKPKSCYINCRLLTKGTDNSSKWLTLAYLNKDRDSQGRDLRHDRATGSNPDRNIHGLLKRGSKIIDTRETF